MMFCYKCGAQIDDEAVICPHCGCATKNYSQAPVQPEPYDENASIKSRTIALLLCIFLGVIGVHRFYIGKIGTGILWFFTGGLFGIGWLVDLILIACGSMQDGMGYRIVCWEPA